jgi:hypothetical protein
MAALFGLDMEAPAPVKEPIPKTAPATKKKRGARKETKI